MAFISMPELNTHLSRTTKITLRIAWIALYPVICLLHEAYAIVGERSEGYIQTGPKPCAIASKWRRRRSLTIRNLKPHEGCLLLALPREVRDQIWRLVVWEISAVHVGISFLNGARGLRGFNYGIGCEYGRCDGYTTGNWISSGDYHEPPTPLFGVMGCLLSCNQIYSEAISFLYSHTKFIFGNGPDIVHLPRLLLSQRINLIGNLDVRWYLLDPPSLPSPQRRSDDPVKMEKARKKNHHYRKTWTTVWRNLAAIEGLKELKVEVKIGRRRQGCVMARRTQAYLWTASDLQIVTTITKPTILELFLPAELEQRVRSEVTAPNLRILPTMEISA